MNLNTNYLCVFKNIRDKSFISHLARQILPENSSQIVRMFNEATTQPYSHILFDLRQSCPDILRYRTHLGNDFGSYCYCSSEFIKNTCENHEKIDQAQTYSTCVEKF